MLEDKTIKKEKWMKTVKFKILLSGIIIFVIFHDLIMKPVDIKMLSELSYEYNGINCIVYVMEGFEYVPYFVIKHDNGVCLLLRKNLLDMKLDYSDDYSKIDKYLNGEFLLNISKYSKIKNILNKKGIKELILYKNLGVNNPRQIFLLNEKEYRDLEFFKDDLL